MWNVSHWAKIKNCIPSGNSSKRSPPPCLFPLLEASCILCFRLWPFLPTSEPASNIFRSVCLSLFPSHTHSSASSSCLLWLSCLLLSLIKTLWFPLGPPRQSSIISLKIFNLLHLQSPSCRVRYHIHIWLLSIWSVASVTEKNEFLISFNFN